ncbi:hypothetical protein [Ureibacillus sp. FSL W8-0352]
MSHDKHRKRSTSLEEGSGDLLEGGVTTGIKRTAIHGSYIKTCVNHLN